MNVAVREVRLKVRKYTLVNLVIMLLNFNFHCIRY